jgi:hypothetical protein
MIPEGVARTFRIEVETPSAANVVWRLPLKPEVVDARSEKYPRLVNGQVGQSFR